MPVTRPSTGARVRGAMACLVLMLCAQAGLAQETASDTAEDVVAAYHLALQQQNEDAARALLAPDLVVMENGHVEDAATYLAHHLPADMEFASAVQMERKVLRSGESGDDAWVLAETSSSGNYKGRPIAGKGAELMLLRRTNGQWRIHAIHWSSYSPGD